MTVIRNVFEGRSTQQKASDLYADVWTVLNKYTDDMLSATAIGVLHIVINDILTEVDADD